MRRKRLPPKPEPPPEGYMYFHGHVMPIKTVEERAAYKMHWPYSWRGDPTYNMKITKRPTTTKEK